MCSTRKNVSIKDIARAAGVTSSTVSRALRDSSRVNPETKKRIQRIADEMDYVPSAIARSLVTNRTYTIGVVVTTITDLFFAEVVHAIEETASRFGNSVVLAVSRGRSERELEAIRSLRERRVDGIILISGCSGTESLCSEVTAGVPLVIINSAHEEHIGLSVEVDNVGGGKIAALHLLDLGHERIAHIAGPVGEWDAVERQRGYEQALQERGLPVDPSLVVRGDSRPTGGIEAMEQLLALSHRPTAVFCYNDATAIGAMRAARRAGWSIPRNLSVLGFDDIDLAPFLEPPLTTIAQPKQQMGESAVKMILELVAGAEHVQNCVLPSQLVIRDSTMSPM